MPNERPMNLNQAISLASIIRAVQRNSPVARRMESPGGDDLFNVYGEARRIHRDGEWPGEDYARDTDDVRDLYLEVWTAGENHHWLVSDLIADMAADYFIVDPYASFPKES
jgi:hypothetical protein